MVGAFQKPSSGREPKPIHSIPYSVAQPLDRGYKNYYSIIQGNRIAQRRIHAGIKQTNLAETVGISNNYLSSIERGKERPSLEILVSICNALHVTPDYLLMGNMHSNNIPQNITDGLRLCSENDLDLILAIVQIMVRRSPDRWNSDNYF